jgi:hypothetical protein
MTTLGAVLREADSLDGTHALYLPFSEVWTEATPCAVLDPGGGEGPEDAPPFARQYGLGYALGISAVQDIVSNARLQRPGVDTRDLVTAFLFYHEHDAFIAFSSA